MYGCETLARGRKAVPKVNADALCGSRRLSPHTLGNRWSPWHATPVPSGCNQGSKEF